MCLMNNNHAQLTRCPHGTYYLRVGNTTLHLTEKQVLDLYAELDRCVCIEDDTPSEQDTQAAHNKPRIDAYLN